MGFKNQTRYDLKDINEHLDRIDQSFRSVNARVDALAGKLGFIVEEHPYRIVADVWKKPGGDDEVPPA